MKLTVVIVNYNVKYYLEQCLLSLYRAVENIPTEVIVVDNASTDGSPEYIAERFPQLTYIYNKRNVALPVPITKLWRKPGENMYCY